MMTIPYICYGIPLFTSEGDRNTNIEEFIENYQARDRKSFGVHTFYHGGSQYTPAFLGIVFKPLKTYPWISFDILPTEQVKKEIETRFTNEYLNIEKEDLASISQCPEPQWFFLDTTS